jgi:hypothetical protein
MQSGIFNGIGGHSLLLNNVFEDLQPNFKLKVV